MHHFTISHFNSIQLRKCSLYCWWDSEICSAFHCFALHITWELFFFSKLAELTMQRLVEDLLMLTSQVINPCERGKVKCSKNIFTTYTPDWVLASQEFQHFFFGPSNANRYSTQKYNVLNGESYYRSLIMSFSLNIISLYLKTMHFLCTQTWLEFSCSKLYIAAPEQVIKTS